jgi:hypothetical protein
MGSACLSQNMGTVVGSCEEANKTLGSESTSRPRRIILHTVRGCHVYSATSLNVNQAVICNFTTAVCFNMMNI